MHNPLFAGIDVSIKDNMVCCLTNDDKKRPLSGVTVLNNRPGTLEPKQRISQLVQNIAFMKYSSGF